MSSPDYLNQTIQTLIAMGVFMREIDEAKAKSYLGGAVIAAARDAEMGDDIPRKVFETVFPGENIPTAVSDDIMDTLVNRQLRK
ncbi:hypothetical protein R3F64_01215 [Halomonas sp. 5021]|jgi:hypothetical protein|uniref:hypothetical protein n=1 Tax=Halomonas sp. 5021 TaxID=3082156 RepID=UPI002FC9E693